MTNVRLSRPADSRWIERVTQVTYDEPTRELSTPDGCWDIVVMRRRGVTTILQTGLISRPVVLENEPGDSFLAVSFKPGVFATKTPGIQMIDRALVRPLSSERAFRMEGETFEVPTFENAEDLVARLARRGLLARDELVESAVQGRARATSPRSMQRHFLSTLGMTPKQFEQVQRARRAVELLRAGMPPAAAALEMGYADQPHLTRSLKALMGQTPRELGRNEGGPNTASRSIVGFVQERGAPEEHTLAHEDHALSNRSEPGHHRRPDPPRARHAVP